MKTYEWIDNAISLQCLLRKVISGIINALLIYIEFFFTFLKINNYILIIVSLNLMISC